MNTALLCESCGYEIAGLPRSGACPECGRPIARSLPEARRGSAWQRRSSLSSLAETNWAVLRRPGELFAALRPEVGTGIGLLAVNTIAASMMLVAPWSGVLIGDPLRSARLRDDAAVTALWVIPLQVLGVSALLVGLTVLEWIGIQIVARRRRWRLLPAAAWQVCAHASVGWVVMGVLMWLVLAIWLNIYTLIPGVKMGGSGGVLLAAVPLAGLIAGLLVFEWLVWMGARTCRFANAPAPEAATAAADSA
jgi:predicted RNA-binding Zn-ribbon protein involved in translation (DUF1610 family)